MTTFPCGGETPVSTEVPQVQGEMLALPLPPCVDLGRALDLWVSVSTSIRKATRASAKWHSQRKCLAQGLALSGLNRCLSLPHSWEFFRVGPKQAISTMSRAPLWSLNVRDLIFTPPFLAVQPQTRYQPLCVSVSSPAKGGSQYPDLRGLSWEWKYSEHA